MPELSAWCIVDLFDASGAIVRKSVTHPDPAFGELAHELESGYPPRNDDILGAGRILRTQQPELVREISDDKLEAAATTCVTSRFFARLASAPTWCFHSRPEIA
jgi:hypothetical protein